MTAWLPAVRLARRRYWLPLSVPTGDLLAACLISQPVDQSMPIRLLANGLRSDPAFFLSRALSMAAFVCLNGDGVAADSSQPIGIVYSNSLVAMVSIGRCLIGCSAMDHVLSERWLALYHETMAEPLERWPRLSTRWLELTGPAITTRQLELSVVVDEIDQYSPYELPRYSLPETYGQFQLELAQLARVMTRHEQLSNRFSEHLELQKREAVKQFAYGLSHELNNPLANISVRAQGLLRTEIDAENRKSLSRILDQTSRAHDMLAD